VFGPLAVLLPGILVAATGVGAGDLLTAGLAGSELGMVLLWAAVAGALLKWFLNEGIARWQMATGTTLLEGWTHNLGRWVSRPFLVYLLAWSLFTGGALVSACGVAGAGLWPLGGDFDRAKIIWGVVHSLAGLVLVRGGGFQLFERAMGLFIALMFTTVVLTAILLKPDLSAVARGVFLPMLLSDLRTAQLLYAAFGALFMPFLALTLLMLNNRASWAGPSRRNGWLTNAMLVVTLVLFSYVGAKTAYAKLAAVLGAS